MKGAFFLGNREFEVRDMEKRPLAADEVRIRVMACGVCGTDVHIYHGEAGSAEVTPPVVLGHEYAGIVEEVGADVKGLAPGDHVAVDPNIYCGACTPCRDGKKQFCEHLQALGVTRDGGFAQYSAAPAAQCFKLAPELPFEAGAMAEPLACCLHGIDAAGIRPGSTVCVIGGGAIGLLMVQLALGLLMELFKLVGWIESPPVHATMESWLTLNWPSIVLFIYSFIFLFYMGEWLDNHRRVDLKILLPMLCSMVINTMLAGWAQVVGLFKHRHQTNWVKTEHSINHLEDMTVRLEDVGLAGVEPDEESREDSVRA